MATNIVKRSEKPYCPRSYPPRNSGTFYFAAADNNYDWTVPQNNALWQDNIKTLFDPCPPGWRVPKSGVGTINPWQSLGTADWGYAQGTWSNELGGALWTFSANNVWYSGAGCRYTTRSGLLTRVGIESDCWTTTFAGANYFNLSAQPTLIFVAGTYHPAAAFSVRCIRE